MGRRIQILGETIFNSVDNGCTHFLTFIEIFVCMDLKSFFRKNWPHFAVVGFILILTAIFYQPQLDGMRLKQHDVEQWMGMSNETYQYRDMSGEEPLWTNSMFGGMPTMQISILYPNNVLSQVRGWYYRTFPGAAGLMILHLIGFYIFAMFLRIKPLIALLGAIAFSFASYEVIIVQAGHGTKSFATAFMPPVLGAMIYAYKYKRVLGALFMALFMAMELISNHFQITYYLLFIMLFVGIYLFIEAYRKKELKAFFITTGALGVAIGFALAFNAGNLLLTTEYAKHTTRGANDITLKPDGTGLDAQASGGGLDAEYITQWSQGIGETFTLVSPSIKGGGSFPLGGSHFEEIIDNSDFSGQEQKRLKNLPAYWGEQPITSGPVYLGIVIVLLAFLGMFFVQNKIKWPLFAVTILAVMLSWGHNFMSLTEFFINYFPSYNKFRVPSTFLVVAELCCATMAMLFIQEFIQSKEKIKEQKTKFLGALVGFFVFMFIVKMMGLGDNYTSGGDQRQLARIESSYRNQVMADPQGMLQNFKLDVNNPVQVQRFLDQQMEQIEKDYTNLRSIRADIFHSSMNRSLIFIFLAGGLLVLYLFVSMPGWALAAGVVTLAMIDLVPVAYRYIGDAEKYWVASSEREFPVGGNTADEQILQAELRANPELVKVIADAEKEAKAFLAEREDIESPVARKNVKDKYRFGALNFATNYRVFDLDGGFNSSRSSYFHKGIGGYHGAKLRNIANLIDYHLARMNERVYDILNTKYFIQTQGDGIPRAIPRPTAMGNAWLVKEIETHETADDEIRALGNTFEVTNTGAGQLLINGEPMKSTKVYGTERIEYFMNGDTLRVQVRAGLKQGEEVAFVRDVNGKTNYVPAFVAEGDSLGSFTKMVNYKVANEFKPEIEAVMLKSEADKLSGKTFTGEGTVVMDEYKPNRLTYTADVKGKQFAVFSEIFYPDWKAYIDGKEVEVLKTDYLLRGIEIPEGKHKIEFVFDVPSYRTYSTLDLVLSGVLILAFGVYIFFHFKNRKKEVAITEE